MPHQHLLQRQALPPSQINRPDLVQRRRLLAAADSARSRVKVVAEVALRKLHSKHLPARLRNMRKSKAVVLGKRVGSVISSNNNNNRKVLEASGKRAVLDNLLPVLDNSKVLVLDNLLVVLDNLPLVLDNLLVVLDNLPLVLDNSKVLVSARLLVSAKLLALAKLLVLVISNRNLRDKHHRHSRKCDDNK